MPDKHKLLIIVCLSTKKLSVSLCATHRRIVSFHLIGDIMITPTELLFAQVPEIKKLIDRKTIASITQAKATLLEKQGARIADKINRLVKCVLNGYLCEGKRLPKSSAQQIFHLIELMNSISLTFNFHWPSILEWCNHACALWSDGNMLRILEGIRQQISLQDTTAVDIASALQIAEHALCHAPTRLRLVICGMALDVANYKKTFRPLDAGEIDDFLTRLDSLSNIGLVLSRVTDCSFVYWHKSLFVLYFENLLEDSRPIDNIELFLRSFRNCSTFLNSAKHCDQEALRQSFQQYVLIQFKEKFLDKLCNEIENDLRLSFHLHQDISIEKLERRLFPPKKTSKAGDTGGKLTNSNSIRPSVSERRLVSLLDLPEFRLGDQLIHVKRYITTLLESAFYNLTVVALHDCETYSKMRLLAKTRYGLHLLADRLPYMSVEQGLDVLLVMRNIHVFVANYSYDLNEQLFVEKNSKNRHLNVMQMQQVVNSIKTHGNGILNTSCHFVYQFLKKKFQIFSQFLFDDQIKSQLIKEIKFYRDSIDELNQMYPVERAEYFNSRIKKIGSSSDISFLDKFRELITQIGNAVGFVRMFRAGASESCFYAANFSTKNKDIFTKMLPDQEPKGQPAAENESCNKHSALSAELLHSLNTNINTTFDNTDDHIEIINVLINVFAREFRNHEKFSHLRNFFIIIPALSINFIEHICSCRSRLGKHRSHETDLTFVDDGFSMGIAYILKLLNQNYFFESLNWFESLSLKYGSEADLYYEEQRNTPKHKDERNIDMSLTMKISRMEEIRREFRNLEHTLQSALIFFKVEEVELETEETFLEEF
uniref:WASH complex subunit 4 n=1 Tax=Ditylenchus dipsaci TaxID=166011 RepID=A0A915ERL4_9BILA